MSETYKELNLKLIFLGHGAVGKTSIVNAMMGREVSEKYLPTIGSTIEKKEYHLESQGITIAPKFWDLGGQRKFNPLNPSFFKNSDVAFLVINVSEPEKSIINLKTTYLDLLVQHQMDEILIIIVGNKIDLGFNENLVREILQQEELDDFPIILTSALTGENVSNLLEFAIYSYLIEMSDELKENEIPITYRDFLELINRTEDEIKNIPVNVKNISSRVIKASAPLKIMEKKQEEKELELEKIQFLQERLDDLNGIKEQIKLSFERNISNVEELIFSLKETPIDALTQKINETLELIKYFKQDFELKLNSLLEITGLEEQL
jgi:small GTP-binding protein